MWAPQKLENFVFLKLELCNLMNTFGRNFKAGNESKTNKQTNKQLELTDRKFCILGEILVNILIESLIKPFEKYD